MPCTQHCDIERLQLANKEIRMEIKECKQRFGLLPNGEMKLLGEVLRDSSFNSPDLIKRYLRWLFSPVLPPTDSEAD